VGTPSPLRAGRTRPGLWPRGRGPRDCREAQSSSLGRAKSFPGAHSDHGGHAGPRARPWRLARPRAGLRCPPVQQRRRPSLATSARQRLFLLGHRPAVRPQTGLPPALGPSTLTAPRPSLKWTARAFPQRPGLPGAPRVTKSPLLRLCCGSPIAVQETQRAGRGLGAGNL
jgi:hypothetical protein